MILHIPHSSTFTEKLEFLTDIKTELNTMTDFFTDDIFDYDCKKIIAPISRLVCDMERFDDDNLEEMSKMGMGVCYTKTAYGKPFRDVSKAEKKRILIKYYYPHHKALAYAVDEELLLYKKALVVDCHSFPDKPLPCNISQTPNRPDICIGTDSFHTPNYITQILKKYFVGCGYNVKVNDPFAGTLVPMKYYQNDKRVSGVMIEINRKLYQDDKMKKSSNYAQLKQDIQAALKLLDDLY